MQFGALGDIHGDFQAVRAIMRRNPGVPFWVCVGDLADEQGAYEPVDAPLYWIKGNNENFDAIASTSLPAQLHYVPNARRIELNGMSLAGLGGTFAPTWYDTPAHELPYPGMPRGVVVPRAQKAPAPSTAPGSSRAGSRDEREARGGGAPRADEAPAARASRRSGASRSEAGEREARGGGAPRAVRDDKRRHFVREEVEACKQMRDVDLFLTHEAPRPFLVGGRGIDAGKTPINEILSAMRPRLHLFGHHHRFSDDRRQGVRSVGLDLVSRSYLLVDAGSMAVTVLTAEPWLER